MNLVKFDAILLAAGNGSRFSKKVPKQYLKIGSISIIDICINQISSHKLFNSLTVVISKDFKKFYNLNNYKNEKIKFVRGGTTRQESVINGLKNIPDNKNPLVIHDAARPGIDHDIISQLLKELTNEICCVVPILPLYDSLMKKNINKTLSMKRKSLYRIQTPQIFLKKSLTIDDFYNYPDATDESEIIIKKNKKIKTILGTEKLLKITTEWDYKVIMNLLNNEKVYRIGTGFDVHSFSKKSSKLFLGGIEIEHPNGLIGHSDADVLLHSITDAILGAISKGDIGIHFPPNEVKWKNAKSSIFLIKSMDMLYKEGGEIINVDATIICEEPKISKYSKSIINNLSKLLNLSENKVSIKATTTENLGFLGRREGIAVMSSVMVKI